LNSSSTTTPAGSEPVSNARARFAFDLGDASSRGEGRNVGHIRVSTLCVRQTPQPLHIRAA
jgi:hypothetical protein